MAFTCLVRQRAMRALLLCLAVLVHQCILQTEANVLRSSLRSCKVFISERYFSVASLLRRIRNKKARRDKGAPPEEHDDQSSSSRSISTFVSIETTNGIISRLQTDNGILREQLALLRRTVNTQKTAIKDIKKSSVPAAEVESIIKHNKDLVEENAILNDTIKEKEELISALKAQNEDLKEEHKKEVESIKKELFELQKNELSLKENIESYKEDIESVKNDLKTKVGELLAAQNVIKAKDEMLISNLDRQDEAKESMRSPQAKKGPAVQLTSINVATRATNINFATRAPSKAAVASESKPRAEDKVRVLSSNSSIGTGSARGKLPDKRRILVDGATKKRDVEKKTAARAESMVNSVANRAAEKSKARPPAPEYILNSPSKKRERN